MGASQGRLSGGGNFIGEFSRTALCISNSRTHVFNSDRQPGGIGVVAFTDEAQKGEVTTTEKKESGSNSQHSTLAYKPGFEFDPNRWLAETLLECFSPRLWNLICKVGVLLAAGFWRSKGQMAEKALSL